MVTLSKKQIMTLFMAFLMVGSILGIFIYAGNFSSTPQNPQTPPQTDQPTGISFEATGVDATVERLFPQVVMTAYTQETDISKINAQIQSVEGILQILDSSFSTDAQNTSQVQLIYVAQLQISETANAQNILNQVKQISFLSNAELVRTGLISLPSEVVFTNSSLNLTQPHTFATPFTNAYLFPQTIAGDQIKVYLQASLASNQLLSLQALEEQNLTAQPQTLNVTQTLPIDLLSQTLSFSFSATPTYLGKELELQNEIQALLAPQSVTVSKGFFFPVVQINFDKNYSNFEQDFKTILDDFNGVQTYSLNLNENTMSVVFEEENFLETKEQLIAQLTSLNFAPSSVTDPQIPFGGEIVFDSASLTENANTLNDFFVQKQFEQIEINQSATFSVQSLLEKQSDLNFSFSQETFEGQVLPTHTLGEEVELQIDITSVRNSVVSINAKEKSLVEQKTE